MRYLSVCSGIEAATVAWHPLGWTPVAFSEIEAFPSAVLAHHYQSVPNLGDMTKHESWPLDVGSIDLLVGGTPCQSFSVAGLRKGLSDPRGGLMLTYLEIARRLRPRWIVWENVPGVLSSGRGRDFGSFLGALGELGYGWAYRVLDAQWVRTQRHPRAVPQRRRRVFVVGCLGDWTAAAAVLFERESVQRNPSPRGAPRQGAAADAEGCAGTDGRWWDGSDCAATLTKQNANGAQRMPDKGNLGAVVIDRSAFNQGQNAKWDCPIEQSDAMFSLIARGPHAVGVPFRKSKRAQAFSPHGHYRYEASDQSATLQDRENRQGGHTHLVVQTFGISEELTAAEDVMPTIQRGGDGGRHEFVAQAFRKSKRAQSAEDDETWVDDGVANTLNGFDTGDTRTTHAVAFKTGNSAKARSDGVSEEHSPTLGSSAGGNTVPAVAFSCKDHGGDASPIAPTLRAMPHDGSHANGGGQVAVATPMVVRRLTPVECERLQAFPDDYTRIPWRKRDAADCPDGPRYKALGNSMAVNCMEWIGERIAAWEAR